MPKFWLAAVSCGSLNTIEETRLVINPKPIHSCEQLYLAAGVDRFELVKVNFNLIE
jgi:hypothetical protein